MGSFYHVNYHLTRQTDFLRFPFLELLSSVLQDNLISDQLAILFFFKTTSAILGRILSNCFRIQPVIISVQFLNGIEFLWERTYLSSLHSSGSESVRVLSTHRLTASNT